MFLMEVISGYGLRCLSRSVGIRSAISVVAGCMPVIKRGASHTQTITSQGFRDLDGNFEAFPAEGYIMLDARKSCKMQCLRLPISPDLICKKGSPLRLAACAFCTACQLGSCRMQAGRGLITARFTAGELMQQGLKAPPLDGTTFAIKM